MRRALLIGCQTDGLVGVHDDLEAMAGMLARYDFAEVVTLRDEQADRAGLLAGVDGLVERSAAGDAVLLYYSGHGWRVDVPADLRRDRARASYQGICPWDLRATTREDFRGVLAEELSARLALLTARTDNVALIFDCCHATGSARGDSARPGERGLPIPWTAGVERCVAALRASGCALDRRDPECNPLAVRLFACQPHQRAFEERGGDGEPGGLLTRALVAELAACGHAEVVWEDLARRVRAEVCARRPGQEPALLGPGRRYLFSTDVRAGAGTTAYYSAGSRRFIVGGSLLGQRVGDRLVALPRAPARAPTDRRDGSAAPLAGALARLEVIAVHENYAEVRSEPADVALLDGATVRASSWHEPRAAVALAVRPAWRPALAAAIGESGLLVAGEPALVRVTEAPGGLVALDSDGLALGPVQAVGDDHELDAAVTAVRRQAEAAAHADALRRLSSARDLDPARHGHALSWHLVDGGPRPLTAGTRLRRGARLTLRVENSGGLTLYCSALLVGPGGNVRLLTRSQPGGVELGPGETYWLGDPGLTGVEGVPASWPRGLPLDAGPRRISLIAIVADLGVDLRAWETDDADHRGEPPGVAPALPGREAAWRVHSLECTLER